MVTSRVQLEVLVVLGDNTCKNPQSVALISSSRTRKIHDKLDISHSSLYMYINVLFRKNYQNILDLLTV